MPCKFTKYKGLQHRMRRTMHYGRGRLDCLTEPLSKMVVDYFENHSDFSSAPLEMDFLTCFSRSKCVNPCTLLVAMIYVNRLDDSSSATTSTLSSVGHRNSSEELFLSALVLATKYLNDGGLDEFVWNDEFASASNFDIATLNRLELQMLDKLNWNLLVDEATFENAVTSAEEYVARASLRRNGFLTYNEINALVTRTTVPDYYLPCMERFVALCLAMVAAYAATVALLICTTVATPFSAPIFGGAAPNVGYAHLNASHAHLTRNHAHSNDHLNFAKNSHEIGDANIAKSPQDSAMDSIYLNGADIDESSSIGEITFRKSDKGLDALNLPPTGRIASAAFALGRWMGTQNESNFGVPLLRVENFAAIPLIGEIIC